MRSPSGLRVRCPLTARAHHLVHWADGGPTNLRNAALVCERHHTVVHQGRWAARLVDDEHGTRVEWDLPIRSYDQLLATDTAREPA
jgi:HNH endonuclease